MSLYYCKKCGRQINVMPYNGVTRTTCDCCESKIYPVPEEYLGGASKTFIKKDLENQFIDKFIKNSNEFDQYLFDNREKILREKSSGDPISFYTENGKIKARVVGSTANQPKCPYCGSTNISKIGVVSRAVSVGLLGLASSKIGKTHKCNKCGSTW